MDENTRALVGAFAAQLEDEGTKESKEDAAGVREFLRQVDRVDVFLNRPEIADKLTLGQKISFNLGISTLLTLHHRR